MNLENLNEKIINPILQENIFVMAIRDSTSNHAGADYISTKLITII